MMIPRFNYDLINNLAIDLKTGKRYKTMEEMYKDTPGQWRYEMLHKQYCKTKPDADRSAGVDRE